MNASSASQYSYIYLFIQQMPISCLLHVRHSEQRWRRIYDSCPHRAGHFIGDEQSTNLTNHENGVHQADHRKIQAYQRNPGLEPGSIPEVLLISKQVSLFLRTWCYEYHKIMLCGHPLSIYILPYSNLDLLWTGPMGGWCIK